MNKDQSFTSPILKTITIQLSAEAGQHPTEARQELALSALAAALIALNDSLSLAWTVQPIPGGAPILYELTPLSIHQISVEDAWSMIDALRGQPQIAVAEPTFAKATRHS